jgi:hypothetical protein
MVGTNGREKSVRSIEAAIRRKTTDQAGAASHSIRRATTSPHR